MNTHNIHFMIKYEYFPKISISICFFGYQENLHGTQKRVRISNSKLRVNHITKLDG